MRNCFSFALTEKHNLELEVGTAGLEQDNLLKYLNIAQTLGAKLVRTLPHSGKDVPSLDVAKRRVDEVLGKFSDAGIILGIENHDHYPSDWIRKLIDAFNDPHLGVCLDASIIWGLVKAEKFCIFWDLLRLIFIVKITLFAESIQCSVSMLKALYG